MTHALIAQNMTLPTLGESGDTRSYISAVNQVPVLSAEDEHELAIRLRDHQDLDAARQLILSHLRFVVYIARGYSGYGLSQADLIQEGNIGLMKAIKRFDPEKNVRLVSFAVHWVRAEIHEFVLRNWRIVKVATTKAQRKLFFNLRSSKKRLGWFSHDEVQAVAKDLGVKPETVLQMESRMSGADLSFDPAADNNDDDASYSPASYLQSQHADPAELLESSDSEKDANARLAHAINGLDERSQDILRRRWLSEKKSTLQELAGEYGVSAERIRQLEANAMKKMRAVIAA